MSEICLDCYNKLEGTHLTPKQVILTPPYDMEPCSECGKVSRLLMRVPSRTPWGWLECRYWQLMDKFDVPTS